MNRRNFLRRLSGAAVGAVLAPSVLASMPKTLPPVTPQTVFDLSILEEAVRRFSREIMLKFNEECFGDTWTYITNNKVVYARRPKGMQFPMYMESPLSGLEQAVNSKETYGKFS